MALIYKSLTTKTAKTTAAELEEREKEIVEDIKRKQTELAKVRTARLALLALETDEPVSFDGKLVDAIRAVLMKHANVRSLAPTEVRDEVKQLGYDFSSLKHDNPMAAVHGVLKRLVDSGEVRDKKVKDGSTRYEWKGSSETMIPLSSLLQQTTMVDVGRSMAAIMDTFLEQQQDVKKALEQLRAIGDLKSPPTEAGNFKSALTEAQNYKPAVADDSTQKALQTLMDAAASVKQKK